MQLSSSVLAENSGKHGTDVATARILIKTWWSQWKEAVHRLFCMQPACCLIRHPLPFIYHCAWEARRLFAPLSVAPVIFFIMAHCQNVVSPHTSLLPVCLWNLCWKTKAKPSFLATKKPEGLFWHVRGPWRHRDHTGDEEENIWVERSHLFLWLDHSLPCGLWELYLLKEHLSYLPKPPLCHLNASVIQSSTILPGNTSTSSLGKDSKICVSYSCKSPLTARLSCPPAKAFPGKAAHVSVCPRICTACNIESQLFHSRVSFPRQRLLQNQSERRRGCGSSLMLSFGVRGPGRTDRLFSCLRVMLGAVRETVVSWNIGLSGNFAN